MAATNFAFAHRASVCWMMALLFVDAATAFTPVMPSSLCRRHTTISSQCKHASAKDSIETKSADTATEVSIWTEAELMEFASQQGILLSLSTLGPGYRAIARAKHNESLVLGYVEGFLRPGGTILHLDKMEVFRKMVVKAKSENPTEFSQGGTVFGIGLLMGYICLLYGRDNGYTVGEFLAIDDEERQHRKLVEFYKRSGFEIVRYVGDGIGDIPDRMLWGGCGTLMRQDIDILLQRWTLLLKNSRANKQQKSSS